jgi:N-acetylneuraminic acid mutarotase
MTASGAMFSYDVKSDTWSPEPALPEDIGAGQLAIVGRELHYFGGRLPNMVGQTTHWRLDLDDPQAGWIDDTPMPASSNHMGVAVVNNEIYAIGGLLDKQESSGNLTAVWAYDPNTRQWSAAAPLPSGRGHIAPSTTVADGKIIVAGGELNGGMNKYSLTVLEYDPTLNQWSYLPNLPAVRSSSIVAYINGKLIVAGGNISGSPYVTSQVWVGY